MYKICQVICSKKCRNVYDIDGLVQERCNSIAKALELRLSYADPIDVWII